MGAYDSYMSCSIGGAAFQLSSYTYRSEPVVREGLGRVATRITLTGDGWIEASTYAAFAAAVRAAGVAIGVSGQNIEIKGLGGEVECSLLAAQCRDGGPHITLSLLDQEIALRKPVRFDLSAETYGDPGSGGGGGSPDPAPALVHKATTSTSTRADGLVEVRRTGEANGPNARAAFPTSILAAARAQYPWPRYVLGSRYETNDAGDSITYELSARENRGTLPSGNGVRAVEGERSVVTDIDDQNRKVITTSFDLVVDGNPIDLLDVLRRAWPPEMILRESYEVTSIAQTRLKATFVVLESADGTALLDWRQELEANESVEVPVRAASYDGRGVLLIADPAVPFTVSQRGRAIGLGRYPDPPAPFWPEQMTARPRIRRSQINAREFETSWDYAFAFAAGPPADYAQRYQAAGRPTGVTP